MFALLQVQNHSEEESYVLASAGNDVFVWSLEKVRDENHDCYKVASPVRVCYCYQKIPGDDLVVDSCFNYSQENPSVFVSTEHLVTGHQFEVVN
jgi:hypothetical protein